MNNIVLESRQSILIIGTAKVEDRPRRICVSFRFGAKLVS